MPVLIAVKLSCSFVHLNVPRHGVIRLDSTAHPMTGLFTDSAECNEVGLELSATVSVLLLGWRKDMVAIQDVKARMHWL